MTCEEVEQRGIAEDYLLGRLSEADQEAYEQHYFECGECYARLEALRRVQSALTTTARAARPPLTMRWLAVAAAAIVAVGGALFAWRLLSHPEVEPQQPPLAASAPAAKPPQIPEDVVQMARVEPPPYAPRRLRSAAPRERFDAAMEAYQAGDFAKAIPPFEEALRSAPGDDATRFYLGASYALTSEWRTAIQTLQPLLTRRDSAYAEEAAFITARAYVHVNDIAGAMAALDTTIAFDGDRAAEARALRAKLAALPRQR